MISKGLENQKTQWRSFVQNLTFISYICSIPNTIVFLLLIKKIMEICPLHPIINLRPQGFGNLRAKQSAKVDQLLYSMSIFLSQRLDPIDTWVFICTWLNLHFIGCFIPNTMLCLMSPLDIAKFFHCSIYKTLVKKGLDTIYTYWELFFLIFSHTTFIC